MRLFKTRFAEPDYRINSVHRGCNGQNISSWCIHLIIMPLSLTNDNIKKLHCKSKEKITKPKERSIATDKNLVAKQMQAEAGALLPKHLAAVESILFIHQGECIFNMKDEDIVLKQREGYIIATDTKHPIRATTDFKGLHFMPKAIKFEYF